MSVKTHQDAEFWIRQFSKPGDLVVDPCGGGFTTAVACYRLGRRFVGCDCDAECVTKGLQRLAEERAKRESLLGELMVWIEDSEGFRDPRWNVRETWRLCSGLDARQLEIYLRLLPENHRKMWQSFPRTSA